MYEKQFHFHFRARCAKLFEPTHFCPSLPGEGRGVRPSKYIKICANNNKTYEIIDIGCIKIATQCGRSSTHVSVGAGTRKGEEQRSQIDLKSGAESGWTKQITRVDAAHSFEFRISCMPEARANIKTNMLKPSPESIKYSASRSPESRRNFSSKYFKTNFIS